ncbi:hypothetical protein [Novosphingobium panipatense]|jgi:hypothetical protein|uniref:hypothetical protein n=1 Tax=Novosphingobium panipatense TaxID=428991 RepID=UPI0039A07AF2
MQHKLAIWAESDPNRRFDRLPVSFLRDQLDRMKVVRCADLAAIRDGRNVEVAGVILVRQRPGSAKGVLFVTRMTRPASPTASCGLTGSTSTGVR